MLRTIVIVILATGMALAVPIQNSPAAVERPSEGATRLESVDSKSAVPASAANDPEADRNKRHLGFGGIGIGVGLIGGGVGIDPYDQFGYGGGYGGHYGGGYGGHYGGGYGGHYGGGFGAPYGGGFGGPYGGGFGGPYGGGFGGPYGGGYANGYQYGYGSGYSSGFFG
ncbi:keratin-associated protein 21-1-like [Anopheles ziemanni]|uniref:keratin-associated protein 21-1-like n=1 Tax=Anopheles coustani TaxID=139045 RepID=UPI0026593231|nr:keratin-associated protein 21-1-like [Anopheles coustani]XP_058169680.1 keratin-associated protein 21-1-like [Anopheles ziemanni]